MRHKINLVYEGLSLERFAISAHIRKCIGATLQAESVDVPCEINVLVTNDAGIHVINKESRDIDRPTDVLSFPMFNLEPGMITKILPRDSSRWVICAFPWSVQRPRPWNLAIARSVKSAI